MHSAGSEANEAYRRGDCKIGDRLYAEMEESEQRVLPEVDGLILVSRASAEDVFERVPPTRRLPSLIAPNFLADDWGRTNGLHASCHGDLVTVGRLAIEKNHRYLLEILAAANRMGRRYTLTVVGDGPERPALHWLRHSLGLDDQVHFLGAQDEVASVLAGHRVYVHGAFAEPFGIVLIEAMAKGLPVVAGPVGGIPDVFRDGIEGRYIPLDSAVEAASVLIELMEDPERLAQYSVAARHRFDQLFRASVVGPSMARFMAELLPHDASLYSASAAV